MGFKIGDVVLISCASGDTAEVRENFNGRTATIVKGPQEYRFPDRSFTVYKLDISDRYLWKEEFLSLVNGITEQDCMEIFENEVSDR